MGKVKQWAYVLLRRIERVTKTDMVYLAKGGFWATGSQFVLSFSSFLLAIAFARFVSKETYGEYKYILSIAGILGTFTLTGLGLAVKQSVSRGYEGTLNYAFWQNIKWSVLLFLGSLTVSIYYFVNGNRLLGISMLVVGCLSPIFSSSNLYSAYLTAKKDFRRQAIYFDIIGNLFPYFCLFLTMLVTSSSVWLVIVYFASNTLIGVILYLRIVKTYRPNWEVDPKSLGYSKHLSLLNVLSGVANNLDQVLVFHYVGAAQLAIYNFAVAIPNQTKGPLMYLRNLIFPKFTERKNTEILAGMKYKYIWLFLASLAMAVIYILIAPYIFSFFFPKYMSSVLYSQIFALSFLCITFLPADVYLQAKKKIKEQYIGNTLSSVLQIVVTFVSIVYWGLWGLIVGRVIVRMASSIISAILYHYSIKGAVASGTDG